MLIDSITEQWIADAKIDDVELDTESLKIPSLHAKYLKLLYQEKLKLKKYNPNTRKHEYFVEKKLPPHSK